MNQGCETIKEQLSSYIDSVLDESEMKFLEAHLASCEECRQELMFLKAVSQTAKTLPKLSVSQELHDSIMAGVMAASEDMKKPKAKRFSLWKVASGFAAAAAVIAVSVISFGSLPGHPELTPEILTEPKQQVVQSPAPVPASSPKALDAGTNSNQASQQAEKARGVMPTDAPLVAFETQTNEKLLPVADAYVPSQHEIQPEVAEEQLPATASVLHDEALDTDAIEVSEPVSESDLASGGGGGSMARNAIQRPVVIYHLAEESYDDALKVLATFEETEAGYLVSGNAFSSVSDEIESLTGYLRQIGKEQVQEAESILVVILQEK